MYLAGDVGGTKTRLGLFTKEGTTLKRHCEERYESGKFSTLEDILQTFLSAHSASPTVACFGIPGPVVNGTVKVTNLPWELSESVISKKLAIPRVRLVNDLVATAAAIPSFEPQDVVTLHPGSPSNGDGVAAVVAPGTGMGQAFLVQEGENYSFLASEGGHANFAPRNEIEFDLHRYLHKKYGHVSVERVLCGPGLVNIYEFLKETGYAAESPELAERMKSEVPAAVITSAGESGEHELAQKALDMFVSILGAHASNVMITLLANKGVYLGGGVPPKIVNKLKDGQILESYLDKGKMEMQVTAAPLYVIKDDHAALTGAARIASLVR